MTQTLLGLHISRCLFVTTGLESSVPQSQKDVAPELSGIHGDGVSVPVVQVNASRRFNHRFSHSGLDEREILAVQPGFIYDHLTTAYAIAFSRHPTLGDNL